MGSMFDKKDKKSAKIQENFSDFWSKFVTFAPEVPLRLLVLLQAASFLPGHSGPLFPASGESTNRLSHVPMVGNALWVPHCVILTCHLQAELRMLQEHPFCPWLHAMST